MANLQFDKLFDVAPAEPIRPIQYVRGVDTRSITFESGVTVLFSDHMSGMFDKYLTSSKEEWKGPMWLQEAWETTLEIINSQKLGEQQATSAAMFLLGRADHFAMYQQLTS